MGGEQANCVPVGGEVLATKPGDAQKPAFDPYGALSQISTRYGVPLRGNELRIPCPAHGGTNRTSPAITVSPSGKVLTVRHSEGCPFQEIAAVLDRECVECCLATPTGRKARTTW